VTGAGPVSAGVQQPLTVEVLAVRVLSKGVADMRLCGSITTGTRWDRSGITPDRGMHNLLWCGDPVPKGTHLLPATKEGIHHGSEGRILKISAGQG
jgi:hypothetical protein